MIYNTDIQTKSQINDDRSNKEQTKMILHKDQPKKFTAKIFWRISEPKWSTDDFNIPLHWVNSLLGNSNKFIEGCFF